MTDPPHLSPVLTAMMCDGMGWLPDILNTRGSITVSVEAPSTRHELSLQKLTAWLEGGKGPREQAMKVRLRELLDRS